jgi:hypothetical protein
LPRYKADTLIEAWPANTPYMLDVKFSGPFIGASAYRYQLNLYVPGLTLTHAAPTGPGIAPATVPVAWTAVTPPEPAAGFPTQAHAGPLVIEVVSDVAEHQLLT